MSFWSHLRPAQLQEPFSRVGYWVSSGVTFVALVSAWHLAATAEIVPAIYLPAPAAVVRAMVEGLLRDGWAIHVWTSCYRIVVGFALAALVAVPTGILMGTFKWVEALLEPLNDFIRYMPVVAFVPLCIIWLGTGENEKVVVIFIGTYFQLVLLVAAAATRVHREYLETYLMLRGSSLGCVRHVVLPAAWPEIFDSLRIAAGWAWSYLVVAELVGADRGIGFQILQSQRFLQTARVIAAIIVVGILGMVTDYLFKASARRLFRWA